MQCYSLNRNKYSFPVDSFMVNDVSLQEFVDMLRPTELPGQ